MLYSMLPGCCSHPGHRLAGAANRARLFYWGQKILKETNQKYITTFLNWQIAQFRACVDKHKGALWHYQFGFPTGRPGDGAGPLASALEHRNSGTLGAGHGLRRGLLQGSQSSSAPDIIPAAQGGDHPVAPFRSGGGHLHVRQVECQCGSGPLAHWPMLDFR